MRTQRLQRQQTVPRPIEEVFDFFKKPENLARLTPPSLGFHILTPSPIRMREGALIDYTVRPLGWPMRWTSLITRYEEPYVFVDEQIRGPYAYWHHTHTFCKVADGTQITDEVLYALPGGPLAPLADAWIVRGQLRQIFDYRERAVRDIFARPR